MKPPLYPEIPTHVSEPLCSPTRNPVSNRLMLNHSGFWSQTKTIWKKYSILETVFTVSILWAWQESDWASDWFVQYCFSFNSPAFKQHIELSQETPWLGVHLHTALPVHLLLATSLSFPVLSVWIPLQGKAVFLCNPQFNTLTWHQHLAAVLPASKVLSLPFMPLLLKAFSFPFLSALLHPLWWGLCFFPFPFLLSWKRASNTAEGSTSRKVRQTQRYDQNQQHIAH